MLIRIRGFIVCLMLIGTFLGFILVTGNPICDDYVPSDQFTNLDPGIPAYNLSGLTGYFKENQGQWDQELCFVADVAFGHVGMSRDGIYYDVVRFADDKDPLLPEQSEEDPYYIPKMDRAIVELEFQDCNDVSPSGNEALSPSTNYLLGNDPEGWVQDVRHYQSVEYLDLWDGIDLSFFFTEEGLKYEFYLDPGVDPNLISITIDGANLRSLGDDLEMITPYGNIRDAELQVYTKVTNTPVPASFSISGDSYGFDIPTSPDNEGLVIDPLVFCTYLGGSSSDRGYGVSLDDDNNIYITGWVSSDDFPTTAGTYDESHNGNSDAFVAKLNPSGSDLIYATYLGGSDIEYGEGIVVNGDGEAIAGGLTYSSDFPTTAGSFNTTIDSTAGIDLYISKLSADGSSFVYSTFLGGNSVEYIKGMTLDDQDNVYLTGSTSSDDFPVTSGAYNTVYSGSGDAFITKLNSAGSALLYSTYFGGTGDDFARGLYLYDNDYAYVTGNTESSDLPVSSTAYDKTYNGLRDVFFIKMALSSSSLLYSSYIGGSNDDVGEGITVDKDGDVYLTGWTESDDFPTSDEAFDDSYNGGSNDVFVLKINLDTSVLVYSTYLGGFLNEGGDYISVDKNGSAHVAGWTGSGNYFPSTPGVDDTKPHSGYEVFLLKMAPNGSMPYHVVFIGGGDADHCGGLYLDPNGVAYVSGLSQSNNLETTSGAYDETFNGGGDAFIAKIDLLIVPTGPNGLKASSGNGFVNLSWSAPDYDGGTPITNYCIYRGPNSTSTEALSTIGNILFFNDTSVTNGQTYFYNLTAQNGVGEGPSSTMVNATPSGPPSAPLDLSYLTGDGFVVLEWNVPLENGGRNISNYVLSRETSDGSNTAQFDCGLNNSYNDTTVVNGLTYLFKVAAVNPVGMGPFSNTVNVTPYGLPSEPLLFAANAGDEFINLSWIAPLKNGGDSLLKYNIYGSSDPSSKILIKANMANQWFNHTGLENDITYYYELRTINVIGEGPPVFTNATPESQSSPPDDDVTDDDVDDDFSDDDVADDDSSDSFIEDNLLYIAICSVVSMVLLVLIAIIMVVLLLKVKSKPKRDKRSFEDESDDNNDDEYYDNEDDDSNYHDNRKHSPPRRTSEYDDDYNREDDEDFKNSYSGRKRGSQRNKEDAKEFFEDDDW